MDDSKKHIGRILLKQRSISQDDLDRALEKQRRSKEPKPIVSQLSASGALSETEALRALSEQFGVPGIDLLQLALYLDHLGLVPREVALASRILPVLTKDDRLFLAMSDPRDKRVIDELEFVTGKKIYPYVAIADTLARTTVSAYDARSRGETYFLGPRVPEATLEQLGLARPKPIEGTATSRPPASDATFEPSLVVDEATKRAAKASVFETADFGNFDEEVSQIASADLFKESPGDTLGAVPSGDGKLVLVVDDEDDIRKLIVRLLKNKGYRCVEADRGLLALRMVKEHTPDLIILDAMLPELHGFDIARRIKGSDKYGGIPIIMISAVYKGWRIAEDLKANYGIEEYIEKPFKIADVVESVARLLLAKSEDVPRDPDTISAEAETLLHEGVAAYKAGDIDRAITALQRGVKIDPLAYRLRYHLALLFGKRGQVYDGISELERAVDLNPKHFPALKNLAILYEKAGFRHKAVEMWERCVHSAPELDTRNSIKEHLLTLL